MAPKAEPKAKAKADAKPKAKGEPRKKPEAAKEGEIAHIPAPDRDAFDEKTKAIQEAIDKLQAEQRSITDAINKRSGGKEEFYAKKAELRAQLDEFSQKINALQEQKDGIQKAMGEKRAESLQMKSDLTKMKKSIGFASEDEIDQRIASIEFKLWTDTVPLKEEKKMLQEMQELKRNRPKVAQVLKMEEGLNNFDAGGGVKQTLQTINEQIRNWMQEKSKVLEERDALNKEYEGKLGDQNAYEERNELNQKIKEKQEERSKIREEFREEERKFRELLNKKRQEQQERYAAERESRQKEWEERNRQKKVEKLDEQPFVTEITLIEQTIKFCKSLTGVKEVEKKEEVKEIDHKNLDGLQVLGKKDERDEFWFEPTKGKKSKGSKPKGKEGSSKPIKHNAETFKLFDQLKLDAPITLDDIPPVVEKLEAMLVKYEAKVADWEKNKEERKAKILAGEEVEDENEDKAESKEEEEKKEEKAEEKEEE